MFSLLDYYLSIIQDKTTIPDDQLRLLMVFLFSIPLGLFQKNIKSAFLRNIYSFSFGLFFQILIFRFETIYVMLNTILMYAILKLSPRNKSGIYVFISSMITLSIVHILRMIVDYGGWRMDISVSFMMFTCKYSYLAFSYADKEIEKIPDLLEYFGFIYFYPASIIGPTYNFVTYHNYIHFKEQFNSIQNPIFSVGKQLGWAFVLASINAILSTKYPISDLASIEYGNQNFLMKIVLLYWYTFICRLKYYSGWKFAQACIDASGISFSGYDENKKPKFDLITTMDLGFEFEFNPRIKIELWNQSVQVWLKKCVYLRIYNNNPKKAGIATLATFMTSAFWHGFYLAYYMAFFQFSLITNVTKGFFKAKDKFKKIDGIILHGFRWISAQTAMNYIGGTFLLLRFDNTIKFYNNFYWGVTVVLILLNLFFSITKWGQNSKEKNLKMQEKQKN